MEKKMIEMARLGDVCEIIAGQSPESTYYNKDGVGKPFFQGKADFNDDYPTVRYYTTKITKIAKINDILLSVRAPVGPTNVSDVEACIGRGLAAVRVGEKMDYKYVYFYFKSIEKKLALTGNGSTFSAITTGDVKNIFIPVPEISEQKLIAKILDKADTLRKKDKQLLQYYDDLLATLFSELFGDPVQNQKNWNIELLGEFVEKIQIGPFGTQLHAEDYISDGIPLVNPMHISNGKIVEQSKFSITEAKYAELSNYYLKEGDIIMGRRGEMGRCALVTKREDGWICGTGSLYIRPGAKVNSLFLSYVLSSKSIKEYLESCAQGVTMANLNKKIIYNIPIIYPVITLQNKFALQIQNIERQKEKLKAQMQESENLFQALLQKAFNSGLN